MKLTGKMLLIIAGVILILVITTVYMIARKKFVSVKGCNLPSGWDPLPVAITLKTAMQGIGTDETAFFNALEPLSLCQRGAVYNAYLEHFKNSIVLDIKDDFSGDEQIRALSYFKDLEGISLKLLLYV